jgi:hypothetical protein
MVRSDDSKLNGVFLMEYTPSPIDVAGIEIPEELLPLVERLSQNAHDVWAQTRLGQGWRYGDCRDDARKLHPDIVPYEALPESEKAYDRNSVMMTLKALIAMGFSIREAGKSGRKEWQEVGS